MAELEAKVLIDQAMEATGLSDFGERRVAGGARPARSPRSTPRPALNEIGVMVAEGEIVGVPVQPAGRGGGATAAPGDRRRAGRPADRHRRPGPHRHDDPLRPPRAGPGHPRAAHLGGRPALPAARDRDLPHRPPHRRGGGHRLGHRPGAAPSSGPCTRWAPGWRRSACASPGSTSAASSSRRSTGCRATPAGCSTRPTWPPPTAGTARSSSTCSRATRRPGGW